MYQLVARNGALKGRAWSIDPAPLILGRDKTCSVSLEDPLVSRRHCAVRVREGVPHVEDLGSSNSTFVNGESVRFKELTPGDELALGNALFLVVEGGEEHVRTAPKDSGTTRPTFELKIGEPLYLYEESNKLFEQGRPRTASDLALLFHLSRSLSQAVSMAGIVTTVLAHVGEHFGPRECGLTLCPDEKNQSWHPPQVQAILEGDGALGKTIKQAIAEPQGILYPERVDENDDTVIRTTVIAPMVLGRDRIGALVMQGATPERMYEESDLEMLLCMAHTAAPYIRAAERTEDLERENARLVTGLPQGVALIGSSEPIVRARELARQAARSDLSVLILGETGAGKELLSRMVHDLSARCENTLVVVNCAAIPDELFESEVFGHERGAFTGAAGQRIGLLEEADGGTLFLDEIGDLSPQNQARILRAIESGTFRRLGAQVDLHVDVRLISATNKDLAEEVEAGRFRRDLYHRLNPFEIRIPPLRQRKEDIPALARHFLALVRQRFAAPADDFEAEALLRLQSHPWPGNIRELRNVVERAAVVATSRFIRVEDLNLNEPANLAPTGEAFLTLAEMERQHIAEALRRFEGNIKGAAEALGIGRSTLYRKITDYGLSTD